MNKKQRRTAMKKYKECPKCQHKNSYLADKCDNCHASLLDAQVKEQDDPPTQRQSNLSGGYTFANFLRILSYIILIAGIIGFIVILVKFTWIPDPYAISKYSAEAIFSPTAFGLAVSGLFISLVFYAILNSLSRLLPE
jgi:hypothetical protein